MFLLAWLACWKFRLLYSLSEDRKISELAEFIFLMYSYFKCLKVDDYFVISSSSCLLFIYCIFSFNYSSADLAHQTNQLSVFIKVSLFRATSRSPSMESSSGIQLSMALFRLAISARQVCRASGRISRMGSGMWAIEQIVFRVDSQEYLWFRDSMRSTSFAVELLGSITCSYMDLLCHGKLLSTYTRR